MNYNKAIIAGRVTANPELRTTPNGQSVTSFGVATNQKWTDKNGKPQESVEFHNIVAWGRKAELASQYLMKGGLVLIEGRLQTRSWTDKEGQIQRTTEILADNIQFGPALKPAPQKKGEKVELAAEETLPTDAELPNITLGGDEEDTGRDMKPLI